MARKKSSQATKQAYDVHPGVAMVQLWIESLPAKTGRSLDEWVALVSKSGPPDLDARKAWLKDAHGLGTNYAKSIAECASGREDEFSGPAAYLRSAEAYVESMFSGGRAGLRPIFEEVTRLVRALGHDVKVCPCKTMVPYYRKHVFAQVKPTTMTRIDLGLALRDTKPTGRLIDTGGFAKGDRISHRIPISEIDEIDDEVKSWLATAYERDA